MCDCLDVSCVYEYDVCQSPYVLASASPGMRAQAATPSACGHLVHHEGISYCMSALPYVSSASIHTPDDRVNSLTQAPLGVHRPYPASLPVARKKKAPFFLSFPSESRNKNRDTGPQEVISVTSRSDPSSPPLRRSARESKKTDKTADSAGARTTPSSWRSQVGLFVSRAAAPHLPASIHGGRKGVRGGKFGLELHAPGRNIRNCPYPLYDC